MAKALIVYATRTGETGISPISLQKGFALPVMKQMSLVLKRLKTKPTSTAMTVTFSDRPPIMEKCCKA